MAEMQASLRVRAAKQRDQPSLRAEQVGEVVSAEVVSAEVVFGETEGQPHELAQTRAG